MTRIPGIERRKKLKDEIKAFPILIKIHRGEKIESTKRKSFRKENNPES